MLFVHKHYLPVNKTAKLYIYEDNRKHSINSKNLSENGNKVKQRNKLEEVKKYKNKTMLYC
jgi:hypothetical protein